MKKASLLLLMLYFLHTCAAQQKDISVYEKKDGDKVMIMARNTGKMDYLVTVDIQSTGMSLNPGPKAEGVVPAGHILELATLQPIPGKEWSYGYEISYIEYTGNQPQTTASENTARVGSQTPELQPAVPTMNIQDDLSKSRIIVYTTPGCSRCAFVKKQLTDKHVSFETVDVSVSSPEVSQMWNQLREDGFKGESVTMPVVRVDGRYHYNIQDLNKFISNL